MTPDTINAIFEMFGGFILLMNLWRLFKDKTIKGVSIWPMLFFPLWGYWNLYYYPHLNQWWSFVGGLFVTAVNTAWVGLMVYYRLRKTSLNG